MAIGILRFNPIRLKNALLQTCLGIQMLSVAPETLSVEFQNPRFQLRINHKTNRAKSFLKLDINNNSEAKGRNQKHRFYRILSIRKVHSQRLTFLGNNQLISVESKWLTISRNQAILAVIWLLIGYLEIKIPCVGRWMAYLDLVKSAQFKTNHLLRLKI